MGKKAKAPPPPDMSAYSSGQMNIANRMQEFAQKVWDTGQSEWGKLSEFSSEMMGMLLPEAEEMFDWAREQRGRYESMTLPQIESLFKDADTYASKAEEDRQRGAAIQDVKSSMQAEREAQLRKLEGYGIDPSTTRYQALDRQAGIAEAAMSSLAANQAGERTKAIGRELRKDAINVGTGFLNDANQSAQIGANMGATGANIGANSVQVGNSTMQGALPYLMGASGAVNSAAGIVDTSYGRSLDKAADDRDANKLDLGGMGKLAGLGMSFIPGIGPVAAGAATAAAGAATGGEIQAPGGPTDDAGIIRISDGEYVIPAEVVNKMGAQVLDKFVSKSTGQPAPSAKTALPVPS